MRLQVSFLSVPVVDLSVMKIQVHDFGGYEFAADLSVRLADLGYDVEHLYCAQYSSNVGDFSRLRRRNLTFRAIAVDVPADKYGLVGRTRFEFAYGRAWQSHTQASTPDLVVCANVPLLALGFVRLWSRRTRRPWVLWHQDVVSVAMASELRRRLPAPLAAVGATVLDSMERSAVRSARSRVVISRAFEPVYERWRLPRSGYEIVRNWAPLNGITPGRKSNDWARTNLKDHQLPRLIYAGTLGRKHKPQLLTELARAVAAIGSPVHLVIVSEGEDAASLSSMSVGDSVVTVLPFQPAERLSDVLAAADVLVALLESSAADFSVPSKVATYLAAGRPVLGLLPMQNAAAADILDARGFVVPPDRQGVEQAAHWLQNLLRDPDRMDSVGRQSRRIAQRDFNPEVAVESLVRVIRGSLPA